MGKLLFLTGTRADYGKLKPLIREAMKSHEVEIFATGMHMRKQYGLTLYEITRDFPAYPFINQDANDPLERILSNTVHGLSLYVHENPPDLLVVHGDRVEALAGAIVGNFNGILTAHIEGGELSGTIDGMIRHSITKLAHVHFCANEEAKDRLIRMGEHPDTIYPIGSPDIDIMLSSDLPTLDEVRGHYRMPEGEYGILIYHPVVGEHPANIIPTIHAAMNFYLPFVAIYPNNDPGSEDMIRMLEEHRGNFHLLPSMRFEYFLTLLKNAKVIIGNSSAGVREAPVYGVPSINIGTRQEGRVTLPSVFSVPDDYDAIMEALQNLPRRVEKSLLFGKGDSAVQFCAVLAGKDFWTTPRQKRFWEGEQ